MNKFAILTFVALTLFAWLYGGMNGAFPFDDPASDSTTDDAAGATEGAAETAEPEAELPASPPDDEALAIFQDAQRRLFQHESIKARYREIVSFPNRSFVAGGTYLAGGQFKMRLEYQVELGDMRGTLLQVCDGQVSWTRREIIPILASGEAPAEEDIFSVTSRRDIHQILKEAEGQRDIDGSLLVAEMGLGGLPAMMAGIEKMMTFDGHETVEWDGRRYVVVQGRWKENLPAELQQITAAGPERVRVFLSDDTLFPERFVYLQRTSETADSYRKIVELQFLDVEFDAPVSADAFRFVSPPGTEEIDETHVFLDLLNGLDAGEAVESQATPLQ